MKSLSKLTIVVIIAVLFTSQAFANGDPNSKLVEKAKKAVSEADATDWETLAQSAEICFMKNENIEEASQWINKSIEIKATPYNLEVKGDYLSSIGENKEAISNYYQAILKSKEEDSNKSTEKLQSKMWKLR